MKNVYALSLTAMVFPCVMFRIHMKAELLWKLVCLLNPIFFSLVSLSMLYGMWCVLLFCIIMNFYLYTTQLFNMEKNILTYTDTLAHFHSTHTMLELWFFLFFIDMCALCCVSLYYIQYMGLNWPLHKWKIMKIACILSYLI